jgi:hypothetical protein
VHKFVHEHVLPFLQRHVYIDRSLVDVSSLLRREYAPHALRHRARHLAPAPRRLTEPQWLHIEEPDIDGNCLCGCYIAQWHTCDSDCDEDDLDRPMNSDEGDSEDDEDDMDESVVSEDSLDSSVLSSSVDERPAPRPHYAHHRDEADRRRRRRARRGIDDEAEEDEAELIEDEEEDDFDDDDDAQDMDDAAASSPRGARSSSAAPAASAAAAGRPPPPVAARVLDLRHFLMTRMNDLRVSNISIMQLLISLNDRTTGEEPFTASEAMRILDALQKDNIIMRRGVNIFKI